MESEIKRKVLIVDNNKVILRLLSHFLEKNGYDVTTAEDGLLALQVLESIHPDFIFIDLIMPKINGEKLCRIIRKIPDFDSTHLIIISAIATEENVDFLSFGANACIAKGPAKIMQENISTVISCLDKGATDYLAGRIFGSENVSRRDITKELLTAQKHFEITLNNITDGFLELTHKTKIIFANKAAANLFGLSEEKLLTQIFPSLFDQEQELFLKEIITHLPPPFVELGEERPIKLNGKYLLIKLIPIYDNGQKFILVLMQDISKRKKMELEIRQHREQLEEKVAQRTAEYEKSNQCLLAALSKVKLLSGLIPICASCKKIRDDKGYWNQIESYICKHSEAEFSHGICPDCAKKLYPEFTFKTAQN